jgi:S1/P1 Nuclease
VRNSIKLCGAIVLFFYAVWSAPALAWGDEGHEVIALIAQSRLDPGARKNVDALLAADTDSLTEHNIAAAATWADKFRDSDRNGARQNTRLWHFVDLEIAAPDLDRACFGRPALPAGTLASNGPAQDCVVDKIDEFAAELANPATDPSERVVALKFLLHLVGDLHQPLHAADDHDRGGNDKRVSAPGMKAETLHHYWDTEFVEQLGPDSQRIATTLIGRMSSTDARNWAQGKPADWAMESFKVAKDDAYGRLPTPNARGKYRLTDDYVAMADRDVASQLSKAGVRLAVMLNRALGQGNGHM